MSHNEYITIHGTTPEGKILPRSLPFAPPYASIAPNPDAFTFWWQLLDYCFSLPSPGDFPKLPTEPTAEEAIRLHRFTAIAGELATSTLLNHSSKIKISLDNYVNTDAQEPEVDSEFTSNEITRGFAVLFRQFFSNDEGASFNKVYKSLSMLSARADDEHRDHRLEILKSWKRAQGRLRSRNLKTLVYMKMREEGLLGGEVSGENAESAEMTISTYNYGEYIHWGQKREQFEAWGRDPLTEALSRMRFLDCVGGLSHLYLGFSVLTKRALGM